MAVEFLLEKWSGEIAVVYIGATKSEGGTRSATLKIGGEKSLPFLFAEGALPNKPKIAFEIWDIPPVDWPQELTNVYGSCLKDTFDWAFKCVKEYKAESLCVRLQGGHPDFGNRTPQEEA
jgi:acetyl-CoA decarbonylase/synthase complex subunit delta